MSNLNKNSLFNTRLMAVMSFFAMLCFVLALGAFAVAGGVL
jgi:hypothetical protein